MEKIHRFIQKLLVASVALCFSFVVLYTPQPINQIQKTEAFFGADAKEVTQWINRGLLLSINTFQGIVSFAVHQEYIKQFILDPIAWFNRKLLLAEITNSMIAWINSGFRGAPMFVQDLERYMLTISDRIYGEFIHRVGAAAFVCQPFRANVQRAFAQAYQHARIYAMPIHTVPTCNLTGPIQNMGNFINGSFNDGGWDAWYMLATQSDSYTPYGSLMSVQDEAVQLIANAEQAETRLLEFGDGFVSNKICSQVTSAFGVSRQRCNVSTPGQVISEALNFQLTTGVESLIAADEFGELIGNLVARIGSQALMGAGGLLGLSAGTGYTDYATYGGNTTAIDQMVADQEATRNDPTEGVATNVADDVRRTLQREYDYQAVATTYRNVFIAMNEPRFTTEANNIDSTLLNPTTGEIPRAVSDIQQLISDFQTGNKTMAQAYTEFKRLTSLHTPSDIEKNEDRWFSLFYEAFSVYDNVANKYDNEKRIVYTYKGKLEAAGYTSEAVEAQNILDSFSRLRQIFTDYSTNRATDPLAGSKAVQAFLNIQGTLYTEAEVEAKISHWIDLVGPLQ